MDQLPYATPPCWWAPRLRPVFMRAIRFGRLIYMRRREGVRQVQIRGHEHVADALKRGCGILITPKHAGHADPFVMACASEHWRRPCYYMICWQSLHLLSPVVRWMMRAHGCFSVDREGHDLRAFRQAVEIVRSSNHPLVIFPEGEIYHHNDHVYPFRTGAAATALAAARRANRPVVCIPAAIKYEYINDPMPELLPVMDALEQRLDVHPQPGAPLDRRLIRFADLLLERYEMEHLGRRGSGLFGDRIEHLNERILQGLESRHGLAAREMDVPDRVTNVRQRLIAEAEGAEETSSSAEMLDRDFAEAARVIQLYSYAHDFDRDNYTVENCAEMIDKLEEDVLGLPTANVRGRRRATATFGAPIEVQHNSDKKSDARLLTKNLEMRVQQLLDE